MSFLKKLFSYAIAEALAQAGQVVKFGMRNLRRNWEAEF
jgi:hypothetical protein